MKRLILLMVMLVSIPNLAFGIPQDVGIGGPYLLSFDIGLDDYDLTIKGPVETELLGGDKRTDYYIYITSNTKPQIMLISLYNFGDIGPFLTPTDLEQMLREDILENATNIQTDTLSIDSVEGIIASYDMVVANQKTTFFGVIFQPFFDQGRSMVWIYSNFPWDQGTMQMVKTIHVRSGNVEAPIDWGTYWNEMEKRGLAAEKLTKSPGAGVVKWNQHEYEDVYAPYGISWDDAKAAAEAKGGHLVTITSEAENQFVYSLVEDDKFWIWDGYDGNGPWLGGYQKPGSTEPAEGWSWVDGEPFAYTNWGRGEPNNAGIKNVGFEESIEFIGKATLKGDKWNDKPGSTREKGYIIEWG
jgi:hypothetical protein